MAKRELKNEQPNSEELDNVLELKTLIGIVDVKTGFSLNLRKEPNIDSEVLTTLENATKLVINETLELFYNVTTECGIDGFVMKEFVKI